MRYSKNSVREAIVVALISIGLLGMSTCPSWLQFASAISLRQVGPKAKKTVSALRAQLKDRNADVRQTAAEELGAIGPEAKEAVPDLRAALKDRNVGVRQAAAVALLKIGP
jgi:HEAT repeat protein